MTRYAHHLLVGTFLLAGCGPKAAPVVAPIPVESPSSAPSAPEPAVAPAAVAAPLWADVGVGAPPAQEATPAAPPAPAVAVEGAAVASAPPPPVADGTSPVAVASVPYASAVERLASGDASVAASVARELAALLDARPDDALLAYNLGVAEMKSGRPDTARQYWQRALDRDPGLPQARVNLAALAVRDGNASGAVSLLQTGIASKTSDLTLRVALVQALTASGRASEAITEAKQAILAVGRPDIALYLALGEAYVAANKPMLAQFAITQAQGWENNAQANALMGYVQVMLGAVRDVGRCASTESKDAERYMVQALQRDPSNAIALATCLESSLANHDHERAYAFAETYARLRPRDLGVQSRLGAAALGRARLQRARFEHVAASRSNEVARKAFETVVAAQPTNPDPHRNLAMVFEFGLVGETATKDDLEAAERELDTYEKLLQAAGRPLPADEIRDWRKKLGKAKRKLATKAAPPPPQEPPPPLEPPPALVPPVVLPARVEPAAPEVPPLVQSPAMDPGWNVETPPAPVAPQPVSPPANGTTEPVWSTDVAPAPAPGGATPTP